MLFSHEGRRLWPFAQRVFANNIARGSKLTIIFSFVENTAFNPKCCPSSGCRNNSEWDCFGGDHQKGDHDSYRPAQARAHGAGVDRGVLRGRGAAARGSGVLRGSVGLNGRLFGDLPIGISEVSIPVIWQQQRVDKTDAAAQRNEPAAGRVRARLFLFSSAALSVNGRVHFGSGVQRTLSVHLLTLRQKRVPSHLTHPQTRGQITVLITAFLCTSMVYHLQP